MIQRRVRSRLQACGLDETPGYLLRDRDAVYGTVFQRQAAAMGMEEVITAAGSPWQPGQFRMQTYTVFGLNFGANQQE